MYWRDFWVLTPFSRVRLFATLWTADQRAVNDRCACPAGISPNMLKSWLHKEVGCCSLQVPGWRKQRSSLSARAAQPSESSSHRLCWAQTAGLGERQGYLDLIGGPWPRQLTTTETPLANPRVRQGLGGSEQQNFSPGTFALSRKIRNGVSLFRFMCPFEADDIWQKWQFFGLGYLGLISSSFYGMYQSPLCISYLAVTSFNQESHILWLIRFLLLF